MLKRKLEDKSINFLISDNFSELSKKGFSNLPLLKIDESYYELSEAIIMIDKL